MSPKHSATSLADESMSNAQERNPAMNNRKSSECVHQHAINILDFYAQKCQEQVRGLLSNLPHSNFGGSSLIVLLLMLQLIREN
jgi:hypothetical protein